MSTVPVITIDGPSGSGKGTIGQLLAKELSWHFLDSGAVYRVLALAVLQKGIDPNDIEELERLALGLELEYELDSAGSLHIYLDKQEVTEAIRGSDCGEVASQISTHAGVRVALLERQRAFRKWPGLVADGRDMGTVVFPDAPLKVFLMASLEERAQRRYKQLQDMRINVSLEQILQSLSVRDRRDEERAVAPLKPAVDAMVIDTTHLSVDEVLSQIISEAKKRVGTGGHSRN